jgi:hypothetical protein
VEDWVIGAFIAGLGFIAGYLSCLTATWARMMRQDSEIRMLLNEIQVLDDTDDEVPIDFVKYRLESMVQR